MQGYGTTDEMEDYWELLGYDLSALGTDTNLDALRLRGSIYIDGVYGRKFLGAPTNGLTQERQWPRTGVTGVASDAVPAAVAWAAYEAAYAELVAPGTLAQTVTPNKRIVEVKAGSAGVKFADGGDTVEGASPIFTRVAALLLPYLRASNLPAAMVV